ncbi:MAG: hypothetical protein AAGJ54_03645 [Planctomycetota bacterium]
MAARILSIICSFAVSSVRAQPQTFTVPTPEVPTLAFALSDSNSPLQPGDTVQLTAGYSETGNFVVAIDNLTIRGASAENVSLTHSGVGRTIEVARSVDVVRLERLTITGGGIDLDDARATIVQCVFEDNESASGGAMRSDRATSFAGDVFVDRCVFRRNNAMNAGGGAIAAISVKISDSVFQNNTAQAGGAVLRFGASGEVEVFGSQFINNQANVEGGAIRLASPVRATIAESEFVGNTASFGGAIDAVFGSFFVYRTAFLNNTARQGPTTEGGAIRVQSVSTSSLATFASCIFAGNAGEFNGSVAALKSGTTVFLNCTVADNDGPNGAVFFLAPGSRAEIVNSIIRRNNGTPFSTFTGPAFVLLEFSNIAPFSPSFEGGGNFDRDPLFRDPVGPDGVGLDARDNDYSLRAGSPSIDAGNTLYERPPTQAAFDPIRDPRFQLDLSGGRRVEEGRQLFAVTGVPLFGRVIDQGAFEFQPQPSLDVNGDGLIDVFDLVRFLDLLETP